MMQAFGKGKGGNERECWWHDDERMTKPESHFAV